MINGDPDAAGWAVSRGDELGCVGRDEAEEAEAEEDEVEATGSGTANAACTLERGCRCAEEGRPGTSDDASE